ncbi:MAG: hypothetical protein PHD70_07515 [Anaerostipes sp.]|uniref:Uncharacterized protein n=2 Tax=Hespellia stercorisuis TaxID=180311 RepID=A0A1M6VNC9_9FIRM|nr:hypothetical protein [Anaerostipes sp.]SHK82874.1 hypothetical protein SAMN02745243_03816 [Hespellia stercorisuis DSM 15480]
MSKEDMNMIMNTSETTINIELSDKHKRNLRLLRSIEEITKRGNDAEVRRKKDGQYAVYEVKKNKVAVE